MRRKVKVRIRRKAKVAEVKTKKEVVCDLGKEESEGSRELA